MTVTARITIEGMSCGFCENSVSTSLLSLPCVTQVSADSRTGEVTVTSPQPLDDTGLRNAIEGASFTLVSRG